MLELWVEASLLAVEASGVVGLRLAMLAAGGEAAHAESLLMISEKVAAGLEASETLIRGGSASTVISRYREHVQSNARRLARP